MTATSVADLLNASPGPHYGDKQRYKLRLPAHVDPHTGELVPADKKTKLRTRVTTFIKALDEKDALLPWSDSLTLVGLYRRPDLRAEVAALLAASPDPYYDSEESKEKIKSIAARAKEAGGGNTRRDVGSALHDILSQVITGKIDSRSVDDEFRWHCEAVLDAIQTAGYCPVSEFSEFSIYHERLNIVGTGDLILCRRSDEQLLIADLKTGGALWAPKRDRDTRQIVGWYDARTMNDLTEAAQLAAYATADWIIGWPYDPEDLCTLTPMPVVSQTEGIIIHAPSTERGVALRRLDLSVGVTALETALLMREVRTAKPLIERLGPDMPPVPQHPTTGDLLDGLQSMRRVEDVAEGLDLLAGM